MASTNYTTHYSIPLPLGTDLTTPMDYNESAEAVDTALFGAVTDAGNASIAAGNAVDTANAASDAVDTVAADLVQEKAKIVVLQTRVASMENEIDDVRSDAEDAICAYNEPTATASHAYAIGDFFFYNDTLFKATAPIAIGDTIVANTNCVATNVMNEFSENKVGDLSDLTTTDKSSAVAAINEVNANLTDNDLLNAIAITSADCPFTIPEDGYICVRSGDNVANAVIRGATVTTAEIVLSAGAVNAYETASSVFVRKGMKVNSVATAGSGNVAFYPLGMV